MMRRFTLRTRFVAATIGLLLTAGAVTIVFIHTTLKGSLYAEMQKRGLAVANSFARLSANPRLTENDIALNLLAYDIKKSEEGLAYLYIRDKDGQISVHTFNDGFPEALMNFNPLPHGSSHSIRPFRSEIGEVFDIAVPVLSGHLGIAHVGLSAEPIIASVRTTVQLATAMVVLIILVASGGAVILARTLIRPLQELTRGTEALGTGDLSRRVEVEGKDEIASLARAFNGMAERLEATTVSRDTVSALNHQLALSNKELESFSYSVSHDLRSPLRHMACYSRLVLEEHGENLDAEAVRHLERIEYSSNRMGQLVDSLLQFSRLSRAELDLHPVDLSCLAGDILQELGAASPERLVRIEIAEGLEAVADPVLVQTMLFNLLDNAWKYTRDVSAACISFSADMEGGRRVYRIADNGAGFDTAFADKLFAPFQRLHGMEFEGSGIGLATVQRIIHRHGGQIWAEGEPGKGATFSFTLS